MVIEEIKRLLRENCNIEDEEKYKYFHKTDKGGYAEKDKFLCVTVPCIKQVAKDYRGKLDLEEIQELLNSDYHEERMLGLTFLVDMYKKAGGNKSVKDNIVTFYLKNYNRINGWDLVDLSAPDIIGGYILENPEKKDILYDLASSDNMWKQRIAVVSNWRIIKSGEYGYIFRIADMLLDTDKDLIQKAIGWMLREVGKKDYQIEYDFLKTRYKKMPRTMLRYSIEKFEENVRQDFLKGRI